VWSVWVSDMMCGLWDIDSLCVWSVWVSDWVCGLWDIDSLCVWSEWVSDLCVVCSTLTLSVCGLNGLMTVCGL